MACRSRTNYRNRSALVRVHDAELAAQYHRETYVTISHDGVCAQCDAPMAGRKRMYCSPLCRNRAFSAARKADGRRDAMRAAEMADPVRREKRNAWQRANNHKYRTTQTKVCVCGDEFECVDYRTTCCSRECRRGLCMLPTDHPAMVLLAATLKAQRKAERDAMAAPRTHHHSKFKPSKARRLSIYERDQWTCQLCSGPVDPDEIPTTNWAASLDHIVPRSKGGNDSDDNLRLTHRWCNSVRSDDTYYTAADLAA